MSDPDLLHWPGSQSSLGLPEWRFKVKAGAGIAPFAASQPVRNVSCCLLLACAGAVNAQTDMPELMPDMDLMQAGPAWLVGDHVKARSHFRAAAQRGNPLAQYNLAMMMLYREGGPCDILEAQALLHKAAAEGVDLARDALQHMQVRIPVQAGSKQPFPCVLYSQSPRTKPAKQAPPSRALGETQ